MLKIRCSHIAGALAMKLSLLAVATVFTSVLALAPQAQARQDGAKFVTPTADGVNVRCGSSVAWYTVTALKSGQAVKALEESDGWVRVEYPAGTPIVVKSDEAEVRDGKVVLTRRSRLRAYNPASPVIEECYKAVFDQFLLPGVQMSYLGPVKGRDGAVMGLLAEAPAGATGYVLAREVRSATPAEIGRVAVGAAPVQPPAQPLTQPASTAQAPTQATTPDQQATSAADDMGADEIIEESDTVVIESIEMVDAPASQPATDAAASTRPPSLRELDTAFEQMMREPLEKSDPNELIEQFRAYQLANQDEVSASRNSDYIMTRISALELRAKARALSLALSNLDEEVIKASESYTQTIERLSKGREYQVVGRLVPSTVYDGKRLPLMYRLTSIDSGSSRTIAYIAPEPTLDLDKKVGSIVGVLGESTIEPSSMVAVIRPAAVDVLQVSPTNQ